MGVAKESDKQKKKEEHRERDDKLHDGSRIAFRRATRPRCASRGPAGPQKQKSAAALSKADSSIPLHSPPNREIHSSICLSSILLNKTGGTLNE